MRDSKGRESILDRSKHPRHSVIRIRTHSESSQVSLGFGMTNKEKKSWGFLSGHAMSCLKYAVVWTVYVLIVSQLFLYFEIKDVSVERENATWTRFKELAHSSHDFLEEFHQLRQELHSVCPHHLWHQTDFNSSSSITFNNSLATDNNPSIETDEQSHPHIQELERVCQDSLRVIESFQEESKWSYVDAVYYTMTLVTTIGYGHIAPTTPLGRISSIIFAIVGVPLTCILMATNSSIVSSYLLKMYNNLKKKYSNDDPIRVKRLLCLITWFYLAIGFVIFMLIPSILFAFLEDWTYDESLYYAFITLSTIGFGDYIGAYGQQQVLYSNTYKIGVVVWIMISLSYWIMVLNFLQKALKKKYVPKKIRVQFKAKQMAKQAEFLRQLMSKVRESDDDEEQVIPHTNHSQKEVRKLVAEVTGALDNEVKKKTKRNSILQRAKSVTDEPEETEVLHKPHSIDLTDLLSAEVVVRTPKIPFIKNLIESSSKEDGHSPSQQNTVTDIQKCLKDVKSNEVNLPLYDVLGLVLLVANLESQNGDDCDSVDENSLYSTIHSIVKQETKLPKLREAFMNLQSRNNYSSHYCEKSSKTKKPTLKYKPVNTDYISKIKPQRRGSVVDSFLENQTQHEFVIVAEESDKTVKSDPIAAKMVTEDIEVPDLEDNESDMFNGQNSILAIDEDDDSSD